MTNVAQVIWVEMLKARRSKMSLLTALGFSLLPLAMGFFMIVLKDPELARRMGLISTKAHLIAGAADWPTYIGLLGQAVAGGGMVLFGFIGIWVFGREYSDHTVKDLLALPTARSAIVFGKFVVLAAWSAALVALIGVAGLGIGAAIGLAQASPQILLQGGVTIALAAGLTIALATPIVFFASAGHGYLPPIGFVFLVALLTQVISAAGWGEYFPWSVPVLYSQGTELGTVSYVIVILTSLAGLAGTFLWWEWADQSN
ncbi:MAG: ABC transporter permease [Chloroflexi bacterium]|nr:ABC transporter permease [Chloroflexota bacterium]